MNCSTTSTEHPVRSFLTESTGASMFILIFVGLYGMAFVIYFVCQTVTDVRDSEEYRIGREFFFISNEITEQEDIFRRETCLEVKNESVSVLGKLTDENWLKEIYNIYYSNEPMRVKLVEARVSSCMKKYQQKIENLRCKHAYYVTETITRPSVITTV
jgi:hypothetical protein